MNLLYVLLLKSTCLNLNPGPKFWNQNRTRIATMVRTMRLAVKILSVHVAASITWSHISFTFHGSCYKKLVRFINAKNSWLHMSMIKLYSQTSKVTTSQQQPTVWNPNFSFYNTKLPLKNDYLSTTATHLGFQGWSLCTALTSIAYVQK